MGSAVRLTDVRVRSLDVNQLGLAAPAREDHPGGVVDPSTDGTFDLQPLSESDPLVSTARNLLRRHGGLIFYGPPGTSKSYYARRLALTLAGSPTRVRAVQFHPSYQYEDFVQGIGPDGNGQFELKSRHLMEMAEAAAEEPKLTFVLVIDELSRGDAARIFGEGLTYVEKGWRGVPFSLASGDEFMMPPNLLFLATMNPNDRGVDEVDAAFERRFAKISMEPSEEILGQLLDESGLVDPYRRRVVEFFRFANKRASENPQAGLGHTFFEGIRDEGGLRQLWEHQLRFFFEKAYRLDPHGYAEIVNGWTKVVAADASPPGDEMASEDVGAQ